MNESKADLNFTDSELEQIEQRAGRLTAEELARMCAELGIIFYDEGDEQTLDVLPENCITALPEARSKEELYKALEERGV